MVSPNLRQVISAVLVLFTLTVTACLRGQQSDSDTTGYTRGELASNYDGAYRKAEQAVCYLDQAGWNDIPERYLPRGWSRGDLVRQMACIANKESTFGQASTGPYTGSCGQAFGYWQVASCHKGGRISSYSCPARSNAELRDNPKIAAQCALYVYMESAMNGRSGLGPWEATCNASERNALRRDGQPLFPSACGANKCNSEFRFEFNRDGTYLTISTAADCNATIASIELLKVEGAQKIVDSKMVPPSTLQNEGGRKVVVLALDILNPGQKFNRVRIAIKNGSDVVAQTPKAVDLPNMIVADVAAPSRERAPATNLPEAAPAVSSAVERIAGSDDPEISDLERALRGVTRENSGGGGSDVDSDRDQL